VIYSEQKEVMFLTMLAWQKLATREVFSGFRRILRTTFLLPNGIEADFEIKQEPCTVNILALTPRNSVLLVQQFRPGPEALLLELPGGAIDPGEEPAQAAARELLEETGYRGEIEAVGTSWQCAYSTMLKYSFVARNCVKVQEPAPDDHEFIEVVEMPQVDFRQHLRSGNLTDVAGAYMSLDKLKLL
jgi:ADP-ribose pyrophosphatase